MKNLRLSILVVAAAALVFSTSAFAGTTSGSLSVTASVSAACAVGASALNFGIYDPTTTADTTATGTVGIDCTGGTSATVTLSCGAGCADGARYLTGVVPANTIAYSLWQDSGHTTAWGDTVTQNSSPTIVGGGITYPGTGLAATIPVYGKIAHGLTASVDSYTDTVVITAYF